MSTSRPGAQLPSKYVQLPSIASPQPSVKNQMVPYGSKAGNATPRSALDEIDTEDKSRQIETRLAVAEKSNRALLEEVVRLQGELKSSARRNEDILREERNARMQLEISLQTSSDLIAQMNARIKNTEEKVQEEKLALNSLVNHTKSVEQAVLGSQQELLSKKDTHGSQLQEVRANLEEALTAKSTLERMCYSLMDDMRQLKARVEAQGSELQTTSADLKQRTRKLEDEQREAVTSLKQQGNSRASAEQNTSLLRGQIENRLSELREVILNLRTKQDEEMEERRKLEQRVQSRLNDVSSTVAQQNTKRDEFLHSRDLMQREKEHEANTERLKLQNKMAEMVEEVSRKILAKEMKLREEAQEKYLQLEKIVTEEQDARLQFEKALRDENEKRLSSLKALEDEEIHTLREAIKNDRGRTKDTIQKLDESISLLEKQVLENKKGVEKVMTAEIKSRKHHEKSTQNKLDDVQEKLQVATATLQQAIGGINAQVTLHDDQLRREMKTMLEDAEQARTRALADMDARLTSLKGKMGLTEDMVEARIAAGLVKHRNPEEKELEEASSVLGQNLRDRLESVSLWQDMTNGTVQDFNRTIQKLTDQVYQLEEKYKLLKSEINIRVDGEADHRLRDVTGLQTQIAELGHSSSRSPRAPTNTDIAICQQSIRKLAESIQTVKTVLGMKIQSEQKLRVEEVNDLHLQVVSLKAMVEPLVDAPPQPRLFITDPDEKDRKRAEKHAPAINKWSIYTAYRWCKWRDAMMKLLPAKSKPSSADLQRKLNELLNTEPEKSNDSESDSSEESDKKGKSPSVSSDSSDSSSESVKDEDNKPSKKKTKKEEESGPESESDDDMGTRKK
ncbi:coiled-coil domain-containing protein 154-like isoform X2 [Liolophura sinensis]|uniref:coiled-coil domain-containing protein 154-like isoform X2 n=1 Tax=Liolophura sinensis TaxID=3198878 RepID=UPI0031594F36